MKNDTAIGLPQNLLFHTARPYWTNRDDNSWQLVTDALVVVAVLSVPTALIILYGVAVKNRWAVNSAFMVLYAFACVLVCWVCCVRKAVLGYFSNAIVVSFKFDFGAITLILIAWALLGRMSFYGWMLFVLLWLTFWYPIGASGIWPIFVHGCLSMAGIIDYPGGYVIYFSSGVAGFTAACWVWKNILSQPIFLAVCC